MLYNNLDFCVGLWTPWLPQRYCPSMCGAVPLIPRTMSGFKKKKKNVHYHPGWFEEFTSIWVQTQTFLYRGKLGILKRRMTILFFPREHALCLKGDFWGPVANTYPPPPPTNTCACPFVPSVYEIEGDIVFEDVMDFICLVLRTWKVVVIVDDSKRLLCPFYKWH